MSITETPVIDGVRLIKWALFFLLAGCIGCTATGYAPGRHYVSTSLQSRTGHDIASVCASNNASLPEFIHITDGLTEEDAVAIALWNSPAYAELLTDLGLSRAEVIRAGELKNPDVSILFPVGAKQLEYAFNFPFDSIWLRPHRIKLAEIQAKQVANRLVQDGLNFVRDVRIAHSDLLLAQDQWQIAQNQLILYERIGNLADARVRVGTTGLLDLTTARIEIKTAQERCDSSEYEVKLAQERLRFLMGLGFADVSIYATGQTGPVEVSLEQLYLTETALLSRPDLWAAQYAICAAAKQAELAKWDFLSVTGIISVKRNNADVGPGLAVTLPIFNRNEGTKLRTAWALKKAQTHLESLQETVVSEVRQASLRYELSQNNWKHWDHEIIPETKKAIAISERAYIAGGDSLLNILLNSQQLLDAESKRSQASSEIRRAVAELERSVGNSVRN